MIIAVAGNLSSPRESSQAAKSIALSTGFSYISQKELEQETIKEHCLSSEDLESKEYPMLVWETIEKKSRQRSTITDHPLIAWKGSPEIRIYVRGSEKEAAERKAGEENTSREEALRELKEGEQREARRSLKAYGVDLYDLSVFDLVINAERLGPEGAQAIIRKYLERMKARE